MNTEKCEKYVFSALHSAAAAAALQTIKICSIERALEYFTLPFRARLHTWLACSVLFAVCIHHDHRLYDRRRGHCICVGQTYVCLCVRTQSLQSSSMFCGCCCCWFGFLMKFVWHFVYSAVVLPRQDCKQTLLCWIAVLVACALACSIILSFVRLFIRYLMVLLACIVQKLCLCSVWSTKYKCECGIPFYTLKCFKAHILSISLPLVRSFSLCAFLFYL